MKRIGAEMQRRRALFIAGIVVALVALAALLLPVAPTTPANVELAPETIPLTAGHRLEVSDHGRTTIPGRARREVLTAGPLRRRSDGLWLAPKSEGKVVLQLRPTSKRGRTTFAYVSASAYGPVVTTFTVAGRSGKPRNLGPSSWS